MPKVYTEQHIEEDIKNLLEDTFDLCKSNREEIYWLITLLRGFMKIKHKNIFFSPETMQLREWQYKLTPLIEKFLKKWKL